jgi:spore germination cell wall hydrolase CwlJ-like protein
MTRLLVTLLFAVGCIVALSPARADTAELAAAPALTFKAGAVTMAPIPDPVSTAEPDATGLTGGDRGNARECLATAIYFEARGESAKGQRAVGEVILARTRQHGRPRTVCGVVYEGSRRSTGCQFSFTCDGIADVVRNNAAWVRAKRVAGIVLNTRGRKRVSRGATHYHATSVRPYWASSLRKVARIGSHIFYR